MMYGDPATEKKNDVEEIRKTYRAIQNQLKSRLDEFKRVWKKGSDEDIFAELTFCILTPQSRAKFCWSSVQDLLRRHLLFKGNKNQIAEKLKGVRFRNNKAKYTICARGLFSTNGRISIKSKIRKFDGPHARGAREWLVKNVKGMGYKEASHFLRNIGMGVDLAILDRHILKNLKSLGAIKEIPDPLSAKRYLEIENKMKAFAKRIKIPMSHLDLLLWSKETGGIFK